MCKVNLVLKWGTVLICKSTGSKGTDQNVLSVMPNFCDFVKKGLEMSCAWNQNLAIF